MDYPKHSQSGVRFEEESSDPSETAVGANSDSQTDLYELGEKRHARRQQLRKRSKWIVGTGLLLLIAGGGFFGWRWFQSSQAPAQQAAQAGPMGVPVELEPVTVTTLEESSGFVGTLEAKQTVELQPEIDATVSQILVDAGDRVEPGQVILRLNSDELQAELLQARAALEQAQARLSELEAGTRPEEIAQAEATLSARRAQLRDANSALNLAIKRRERNEYLAAQGAVARDTLDEAEDRAESAQARVREIQAQVRESEANLRQLQSGPRSEEIAQAQARVTEAAAQVRAREVALQDTEIKAPVAGTVGDIPVQVGDYVSQGSTLTSVTQNDTLDLRISIPIEREPALRQGLPVQMTDSEGNVLTTGRISFISPQVNPDSQSILAKATFDNSTGNLRTGQFVRAKIIWNQIENAIAIPTTAIIYQSEDRFVYVADTSQNPPVAKRQQVQLGLIKDDVAQVTSGLQPGANLIVSGTQKLGDGAPIMPKGEPMTE